MNLKESMNEFYDKSENPRGARTFLKVIANGLLVINLFAEPAIIMYMWNTFLVRVGAVHLTYALSFGITLILLYVSVSIVTPISMYLQTFDGYNSGVMKDPYGKFVIRIFDTTLFLMLAIATAILSVFL